MTDYFSAQKSLLASQQGVSGTRSTWRYVEAGADPGSLSAGGEPVALETVWQDVVDETGEVVQSVVVFQAKLPSIAREFASKAEFDQAVQARKEAAETAEAVRANDRIVAAQVAAAQRAEDYDALVAAGFPEATAARLVRHNPNG